ncbi:hypothetical protein H310_03554 [Aphanomyces invadans]|uniref:Uncharacterized protein n=1 Tax=Aphanomyces invadans TaxID=157072 RepID=A0A024UJA9_9STRA|nr:hypothetical protein H310_03554 [Aphanomyces invadans]ETW05912.1 hypothetical protein H310_03554 [Aphanomyces invadans]|eukprot:XP_008865689.1 hypothetical protein H310_03554 [Aphanomyces invadans]
MRRRSRGPLPRRLLNPDGPSSEAILTHDSSTAISSEINDLVSNRKLLAALQHAKAAKVHSRYQAQRNEASQVDMNYTYTESFLPGVYFYKYLASVADVGGEQDKDALPTERPDDTTCHIPLRSVGHPKLQLKCWLPDTIVFGANFPPVWLYSDQNGYIRKVINFQDAHVMEKLGNRRFENDPVVVFKEPQVVKMSTGVTTTAGGNHIKLYNTLELKSALTKAIGSPVTFALQKYVKPKGPKAFVVRAVYKAGRPAFGWTITNKVPFDAPNLPCLNRFCTLTALNESCSFAKLTERAVADLMEVHVRMLKYVEASLRLAFESVVADYIKDDMGQWWLIQVKCFRLKSMRPTSLSSKLGDAYDRSTVQDDLDDDAPVATKPNQHASAPDPDGWKVHKMVPCKLCQVLYLQHEVAYKMTMKMMYETIARIRLRSAIDANLAFLGHPKDDLDSGLLYQTWNVCNLCYALYERDQALLKVEAKFTAYLGCPTRETMAPMASRKGECASGSNGAVTITHEANVARSQPMLTQVPTEFTLCRLMLFFTALYDIPKELFDSESQQLIDPTRPKRSRLYLRFAVLGFDCFVPLDAHTMLASTSTHGGSTSTTCYWIPLNLMRCFHFFAPKTPLASKLRESSGLGSYLADEGTITIQLIRCTDPHTVDIDPRRGHQQQQPPPPTSSLSTGRPPRRGVKKRDAAMFEAPGSYSVLLGSTKIQLYQFRSAYVSKTDVYTSMSSGELFNLKANVGFERIRVVNSKHITAKYNLRQYLGVFVPDASYVATDKLCSEWVDNMNAVTEDANLTVPKAHCDRYRQHGGGRNSTVTSLREPNELEELIEEASCRQNRQTDAVVPLHRRHPSQQGEGTDEGDCEQENEELLEGIIPSPHDENGGDDDDALLSQRRQSSGTIRKSTKGPALPTPPTWCITVMLHRTHNWHPSEGHTGWTATLGFLEEVHVATQQISLGNNDHSQVAQMEYESIRRGHGANPSQDSDIVFDSTHHIYVRGALDAMQAFYGSSRGVCTVHLTHASSTPASSSKRTVDIDLTELQSCHTIDGTFNIHADALLESQPYPPYLSVSISITKVPDDEDVDLAVWMARPAAPGLQVLSRLSATTMTEA